MQAAPDRDLGSMMAVPVTHGSVVEFGRPVRLFDGANRGGIAARQYDVAPDGRFLMGPIDTSPLPPVNEIVLVQGGVQENRARLGR